MTALFPDTSPVAEAVLLDLYRQASGQRKLAIVGELYAATKQLMLGGLRQRHPHATEAELRRRLAEHVRPFIGRLQDGFYVDEVAVREAIDRRRSFNLIHLPTMFKVDVFIPKGRRFDQMQMANRRPHVVADDPARSAYFVSAEDTILAKLEWYRLGGEISDRQWQDVLGIVKAQGNRLDWAYLREQAVGLRVADLLERLAGEQP